MAIEYHLSVDDLGQSLGVGGEVEVDAYHRDVRQLLVRELCRELGLRTCQHATGLALAEQQLEEQRVSDADDRIRRVVLEDIENLTHSTLELLGMVHLARRSPPVTNRIADIQVWSHDLQHHTQEHER